MALSYKARRRWSLVALLIWLPIYILIAVTVMNMLTGWFLTLGWVGKILELVMYVVLGVAWAIPLKSVFLGVGKEDPDA
jgi:hypothetical protein